MPKMIEIDEEQFVKDTKLRETVAKIMSNPDAALKVEEALKMVDPAARTPRLDQAKVVQEPVAALRKEIDDLKAANDKSNSDRVAAEARARLCGEGNGNDCLGTRANCGDRQAIIAALLPSLDLWLPQIYRAGYR